LHESNLLKNQFGTVALLLMFCFPSTVEAEIFKLTGNVVDDNQQPVEFATVRIEKQLIATTTNLKGHYTISGKSTDSVVVVFSMIGYQTRKRVLVNPKGNITLNVMIPSLAVELGGVTISEIQRQTTSMQKLHVEQSKNMPSTSGNAVEDLISTQAGVSTHSELSSQYNVRGGSFDENSVYINGIEVYRPQLVRSGQQEGLSIINSDMVEGIGFSAGGFEAKYGDKMSSVLDITYKKPKQFEGSAAASLLGSSVYLGFATKHFTMTNGLRYKSNRYLLGSLETKGEYDPRFVDYQTYMSYTPNKRWNIDLIGNISQNRYNFKPSDRNTSFGTMEDVKSFKVYFDGQEKDLFRTFFGTLNITRHLGENTDLTLLTSAYKTKERETFDIQGQYWLNETNTSDNLGVGTYMNHARNYLTANVKSLGLQFKRKAKSHNIQAGFTWKNEHIDETSREWEMRDSSGYSLPHSAQALELIYNLKSINKLNSNRIETYIQDIFRFQSNMGLFTLNYGARLSHWSLNSETLFSPRVSLGFIPKKYEDLTFRFATGIYYQAPFYKELRDTATVDGNTVATFNKNIKSQRSIHFVLGADYKFRLAGRLYKFTTEVYYKALSHLIPYNIDNVRIVYYGGNIASGYTTGLDFKLYGEFVPGTDSWISLSLMKAEEKLNGKWVPQPTDQRYSINLFFTDFFPNTTRWKMTLKGSFADGLPFGPPHTGLEKQVFRAPAYRRVDIGMSYRLLNNEEHDHHRGLAQYLRNVWLGLDCFNIFGLSNVNSYYWVTDVHNQQYAVPNYLTGRQINARFLVEF
jgi:hypothetical protein